MNEPEATIPYEGQFDPQTNRSCGAACLSMIYRSFGKEVAQAEIWPAIAKRNRFGSLASTTHLMARDALSRGFVSVAIQVRHPLQALRLCRESGVRAILNHRLKPDAPTGHYTVFVDINDSSVVVHDPLAGPSRQLSHAELLELWRPSAPASEIVGNVLIGVATAESEGRPCRLCRTPILSNVECPRCHKPVSLQPRALLGCLSSACAARMWNYVCCPSCDYIWTFNLPISLATPWGVATDAGASLPLSSDARGAAAEENPWNVNRIFGELDKFCNLIRAMPGAEHNPDIKQQLDFIAAGKEKLKLAQAEAIAHQRARGEQLRKMQEAAEQMEEARRQKDQAYRRQEEPRLQAMEGRDRPSPPLDGNALGRALLQNLGFAHPGES
jgi:peptidase C39-like protein